MLFYIVTPSYNALPWLRRCIRSVADQACDSVEVHHHVQDGASTDGTPAWLEQWQNEHRDTPGYTFTYESAKDKGMYDAINLAWDKLPPEADVTGHINCDEQYLPGALASMAQAFREHPEADLIEGSFIIVDAEGRYICHRRPVHPHKLFCRTVCELITCATFHKAATFRRHGIRFDTRYRSIGDVVFYRDIILSGARIVTIPQLFTTAYALTGTNLAWTEVTQKEGAAYWATLPRPYVWGHGFFYRYANLMRRIIDRFLPAPKSFSTFPEESPERVSQEIQHPTCRWNGRHS